MSHIFISYAHDDDKQVSPIVKQLSRFYRVWIDKAGIKSGDDWYKEIQQGLQNSAAMLVFVSNTSKDRPWVIHELEEGRKHAIPVHPYLIEQLDAVPDEIRATQFLDGTGEDAFVRLMDALPSTARHRYPPTIDPGLIGNRITTFEQAAASLPDASAALHFKDVKYRIDLIGLPVDRTRYHTIYLLGRNNDTLTATPHVQVCVLMSGRDYGNYKVVEDAAAHVIQRPDFQLRMLLIEGPPGGDPSTDSAGGYALSVDNPDEWLDAYKAFKKALNVYPRATPQIFHNGPGVLLYPLGADRRDFNDFELYQNTYRDDPKYKKVMWRDQIFG